MNKEELHNEVIKNMSDDLDVYDEIHMLPVRDFTEPVSEYVWAMRPDCVKSPNPYGDDGQHAFNELMRTSIPVAMHTKHRREIVNDEVRLDKDSYSRGHGIVYVRRWTEVWMLFARPKKAVESEKDKALKQLQEALGAQYRIAKEGYDGKAEAEKRAEAAEKELDEARKNLVEAQSAVKNLRADVASLREHAQELNDDMEKITREQGEAWVRRVTKDEEEA